MRIFIVVWEFSYVLHAHIHSLPWLVSSAGVLSSAQRIKKTLMVARLGAKRTRNKVLIYPRRHVQELVVDSGGRARGLLGRAQFEGRWCHVMAQSIVDLLGIDLILGREDVNFGSVLGVPSKSLLQGRILLDGREGTCRGRFGDNTGFGSK